MITVYNKHTMDSPKIFKSINDATEYIDSIFPIMPRGKTVYLKKGIKLIK